MPARPDPDLPDPPPASARRPPLLRGPQGRSWRALLAEDNPVNRAIGLAMLERLGLWVETASDGLEALQKAAGAGFDLVLMDVQMPRMDGLAATRGIRQLAAGGQVPVIAMTANTFAQDRADCLAAGMNDFVAKPVDLETLAIALARWLPATEP